MGTLADDIGAENARTPEARDTKFNRMMRCLDDEDRQALQNSMRDETVRPTAIFHALMMRAERGDFGDGFTLSPSSVVGWCRHVRRDGIWPT